MTLHAVSAAAVMMVGMAFLLDGISTSADPKMRRLAVSRVCGGLAVVIFASNNF